MEGGKCICGNDAPFVVGTVTHYVRGKEILVHGTPHFKCSYCGTLWYDLNEMLPISNIKYALENNLTEINYSGELKRVSPKVEGADAKRFIDRAKSNENKMKEWESSHNTHSYIEDIQREAFTHPTSESKQRNKEAYELLKRTQGRGTE